MLWKCRTGRLFPDRLTYVFIIRFLWPRALGRTGHVIKLRIRFWSLTLSQELYSPGEGGCKIWRSHSLQRERNGKQSLLTECKETTIENCSQLTVNGWGGEGRFMIRILLSLVSRSSKFYQDTTKLLRALPPSP